MSLHDSFSEDFEASCLSPDCSLLFPSLPEQMCNEKHHELPHGLLQEHSEKETWSPAHLHSTVTCSEPLSPCQAFLSTALPASQMCYKRTIQYVRHSKGL